MAVDMGVLLGMSNQLGRLIKGQEDSTIRMGEFSEALQHLAQTQEHTAVELAAQGATLQALKEHVATLKPRSGFSLKAFRESLQSAEGIVKLIGGLLVLALGGGGVHALWPRIVAYLTSGGGAATP
jgi:hypothetical protein